MTVQESIKHDFDYLSDQEQSALVNSLLKNMKGDEFRKKAFEGLCSGCGGIIDSDRCWYCYDSIIEEQ